MKTFGLDLAGSDEERASLEAIQQALANGAVLPDDFRGYGAGQFQPRDVLLAQAREGLHGIGTPLPVSREDTYAPERRLDGSVTSFPYGNVRTTIPNAYDGELDMHEPRMRGGGGGWLRASNTGGARAMPLFDDTLDTGTVAQPKPTSSLFATPSSGLGLSAPTPETDLQSLDPGAKAGLVLQAFGAGMHGQQPMINQIVQQKRQERLEKLQTFKLQTDALDDSVKMTKGLKGDARTKFIEQQAGNLDKLSPSLGGAFRALAEKPDMASMVEKYAGDVPQIKMAFELGGDEAVYKLMASPEFHKTLEKVADVKATPIVMQKVRGMVMGLQHLAPPEMVAEFQKDGVITASELLKLNEHVRENGGKFSKLALDDNEVGVLNRQGKTILDPLGVLSGDEEQKLLLKRAERTDEPPKSRTRVSGSQEVFEEYHDGKWVRVSEGPRFKPGGDGDNVDMKPATVSVDGKNVAALVDKKGNYYDANTRQQLGGKIGPQLSSEDEKRNRELVGRAQGLDSLEKAVSELEGIAKRSPRSASGLFAAPARVIEYASGSVNPEGTKSTPATTALQLRDYIVTQTQSLSRLSNQERQRIESYMQVGAGGNPANLPKAIELLKEGIKRERAQVDSPRGRPQPGSGKKDYKSMSNDELLDALRGGK